MREQSDLIEHRDPEPERPEPLTPKEEHPSVTAAIKGPDLWTKRKKPTRRRSMPLLGGGLLAVFPAAVT